MPISLLLTLIVSSGPSPLTHDEGLFAKFNEVAQVAPPTPAAVIPKRANVCKAEDWPEQERTHVGCGEGKTCGHAGRKAVLWDIKRKDEFIQTGGLCCGDECAKQECRKAIEIHPQCQENNKRYCDCFLYSPK